MKNSQYTAELSIMSEAIRRAYRDMFSTENAVARDKGKFDVVTNNDYKIEDFLINTIKSNFPGDRILSEETNSDTQVDGRTWTIDPIDGTYNMSRKMPLFGIQCALFQDKEIIFAIVYLPVFDELFYAGKGQGAYLNGHEIHIEKNDLEHAVVSFGDFPHKRPDDFRDEHVIMTKLSSEIAKVRMFGAACIDFVCLAAGRTDGTVIFTKNKWDIAPGILIAAEAGAYIKSLSGDYHEDSRVIIATATEELHRCIADCINSPLGNQDAE